MQKFLAEDGLKKLIELIKAEIKKVDDKFANIKALTTSEVETAWNGDA